MKNFKYLPQIISHFFMISIVLADPGKIAGLLEDATTGEPLAGANVQIVGTALGAATDLDGVFLISNVPPGDYTLKFSYVGYAEVTMPVSVDENQTIKQNIKLQMIVYEGETVEVTAQLEGQARAINQQLTANTIVNVVSKDKIQELPDQNAAESLSRLPGISIQRDAGEGQKVIIRGLAPKFNSITVNGERIPATDAADRSVDLSMISADMLEGIEVFKSLTPDKDADAIGGTVNFIVKKAPSGLKGDFRIRGGYSSQINEFSNYKITASLSDRYFNDDLGVIVTGNLESTDRSSDYTDGEYLFKREEREGEEYALLEVNQLNLANRIETRERYGASLTLDYNIGSGNILFNSFFGKTVRDELRRRRRYNVEAWRSEYTMTDRDINILLWTNSLSGEHLWMDNEINWRASYSTSNRDMPFSHYVQFYELDAFYNDLIDDKGPEYIPQGAKNDIDVTTFKHDILDNESVDDRDLTGQIDFKLPYVLGTFLTGYFKFGGKYRSKNRNVDKTRWWSSHFGVDYLGADGNPGNWELTSAQRVKLSNFIDPGFKVDNYMDGKYDFGLGLDVDKLNNFLTTYRNYKFSENSPYAGDPLYVLDPTLDLEDYEAGEEILAGYLLAEMNLGNYVMFLPGFRYEQTTNDYTSIFGTPQISDDEQSVTGVTDTTGYRVYDHILPMFQLRVKPLDWFDVRLAATNTLSRPDYFHLVPWERITEERVLEYGNPDLKATSAWNYDVFLSFYDKYGLFTIGGFLKNIDDIDYIRTSRVVNGTDPRYNMIAGPVNSEYESKVKGFEIEIQTNLRLLPSPFDGLVIYANYSYIDSETLYPYLIIERGGPPFFEAIIIDTVRSGKMPGQADHLANVTLGYEKGGFSGRLSVFYQGESLTYVGTRSELDGFSDAYSRWDLALQQKLGSGFSIYGNLYNFTNTSEESYLGLEYFSTRAELFGWAADLGVRYTF
jgi:TonB-dependent receptor